MRVTLAVLAVTVTGVVKLVPSVLTLSVYARVFHVVVSPSAPTCRTVNDWTANLNLAKERHD